MSVFIDSGVFFAAAARHDEHHVRAADLMQRVEAARPFTSDHVLVETWSLLKIRFGHATAMRFWTGLRGTAIGIEFVGAIDLERAHAICELWDDQSFDIVDCTSFAVMERVGCQTAATFDTDFAVYRSGPDRKLAFEILR